MAPDRCLTVLVLVAGLCSSFTYAKLPNIVFIVADDLGFNDVGFNNPDILSPNIDKLASEGVILNQSYVHPLCTPSRSAFLTGLYPWKTGLQHGALLPLQPVCAPYNVTLLPQVLKEQGYATHIIGKWHLGFCNWNCTPTYRGFDSFFGFYNGQEDYYAHTLGVNALDLRDDEKPDRLEGGIYSAELFAKRAKRIITNHDKSRPLFMYLPFQNVHAPVQVPHRYSNMYAHIQDETRRNFSGMVSAMDEAIGNITTALKEAGLYDNTLIAFTSDNGGNPNQGGNNFPLRGSKMTIWEGGTRAVAFVHGPMLQKTGYRHNGKFHAVDWFQTFLAVAGGSPAENINMDSMNLWPMLKFGIDSARTEFVYHLDNKFPPLQGHAAIRVGDYKYIKGFPGPFSGWAVPPKVQQSQKYLNLDDHRDSLDALHKYMQNSKTLPGYLGHGLYNIRDDPTEHKNLVLTMPKVVRELRMKLKLAQQEMVPANAPPGDNKGNPNNFGGVWTPGWC
ncbi:LOW QUALITY PROTEIN: arylsulfatase B-like [Lingula anatina]|uniref:LOW QUALITY PROTEIN: arylsulfatase B-like n=1 Tax=Lingula anatina TaxID=7574 RepID=A0A1S3KGD8_LINAN|nr:LOW QUALITY PROTEIN: arylsulfatase B-like [Lingula anatina]|eukprot:XP_013421296.1 LOW QUALITY PROTEIN: arylsulfatase B-like [Lingula anatina]